eukprot:13754535-Alexandrium_andersonii.AAC.1
MGPPRQAPPPLGRRSTDPESARADCGSAEAVSEPSPELGPPPPHLRGQILRGARGGRRKARWRNRRR